MRLIIGAKYFPSNMFHLLTKKQIQKLTTRALNSYQTTSIISKNRLTSILHATLTAN